MAEPALSIDRDTLRSEIAFFLGWGRNSTNWTGGDYADRDEELDRIISAGLRQFYYPETPHEWSFMNPVRTLYAWPTTTTGALTVSTTTLTASTATFYPSMVGHAIVGGGTSTSYTITAYTSSTVVTVDSDASSDNGETFTITADGSYRLPDDFAGLTGPLTHSSGSVYPQIEQTAEFQIRQRRQYTTAAGRPYMFAIVPLESTGAANQRYDAEFFPTPDQLYTFKYTTNAIPADLSETYPYPLGGAAHGETIMESCLAVAEERWVQESMIHREKFARRLAASILHDRRNSPDTLGYCGDRKHGEFNPRNSIIWEHVGYVDP